MPGHSGVGTLLGAGLLAIGSGLMSNMLEKHQQQMSSDQGIRDKLNSGQYTMPEIQMLMGDKKNAERISGGDKTFWDLQMKNRQMKDQMAKWVGQYTAQGGDLTNQTQMGKFFTQQNANMPGGLSPELLSAEQGMLKEAEPMSKERMQSGTTLAKTGMEVKGKKEVTGMQQAGMNARTAEQDATRLKIAAGHNAASKYASDSRVKAAQIAGAARTNGDKNWQKKYIASLKGSDIEQKGRAMLTHDATSLQKDLRSSNPPGSAEVTTRIDDSNLTALSNVLPHLGSVVTDAVDPPSAARDLINSMGDSLLFLDPESNKVVPVATYAKSHMVTNPATGKQSVPPVVAKFVKDLQEKLLNATAGPKGPIEENKAVYQGGAPGPIFMEGGGSSEAPPDRSGEEEPPPEEAPRGED